MAKVTRKAIASNFNKDLPRMNSSQDHDTNDFTELQRQLAEARTEQQELQKQRDKALSDNQNLNSRLNEAVLELAALHTSDAYREDDERMLSRVMDLRSDVRRWSQKAVFTKPGHFAASFSGVRWPFRAITKFDALYKDTEDLDKFPHLVEAFLWYSFLRRVFGKHAWAGLMPVSSCQTNGSCKYHRMFSEMKREFEGNQDPFSYEVFSSDHRTDYQDAGPELYHNFRANASRIIAKKSHTQCRENTIRYITTELASDLKGFVEERYILDDGAGDKTTLQSVVESAIDLDLVMSSQKADYQFFRCYGKDANDIDLENFNLHWMEADHDATVRASIANHQYKPKVQLIRAPAFRKYGTSEGTHFEEELLLLKFEVDCEEPASQETPLAVPRVTRRRASEKSNTSGLHRTGISEIAFNALGRVKLRKATQKALVDPDMPASSSEDLNAQESANTEPRYQHEREPDVGYQPNSINS
jgi:predicted DNA binding CopG/RHH family protein